jgi:hypothetical protein
MWLNRRRARRNNWMKMLAVGAAIGAALYLNRSSFLDFTRYLRLRRM